MTTIERTKARSMRAWAISILDETGAIRECEEHCWIRDRADPHAREKAYDIARSHPPSGSTAAEAAAALDDVLDGIGDVCPECLPEG
jgi:hypothetical protein